MSDAVAVLVAQTRRVVGYTLCCLLISFFTIQIFSYKMIVVVKDLSSQATVQVIVGHCRITDCYLQLLCAIVYTVSYLALQWIDQEFVSFHVTPRGNTNTPDTAMTG